MNLQPINPYVVLNELMKENKELKKENERLKEELGDVSDMGGSGNESNAE